MVLRRGRRRDSFHWRRINRQRSSIQAVLGNGLAAELGNDRPERKPLVVGDTFPLGARTWKVVGILDSTGSTFDSEVWAKRAQRRRRFRQAEYLFILSAADGGRRRRQNAHGEPQELQEGRASILKSKPNTSAKQGETSKQFLVAIIVVAVVMAVGGVFGVMNTMFAAISQRTKDIGVLRILGFARWQILISFLLESLVIALIGGLLGCALGYARRRLDRHAASSPAAPAAASPSSCRWSSARKSS